MVLIAVVACGDRVLRITMRWSMGENEKTVFPSWDTIMSVATTFAMPVKEVWWINQLSAVHNY